MSLAVGDRVRIRLNSQCREEFGTIVTASTDKNLYKHEVDRPRHRPEAEGKLGRIIKIGTGDHRFQVLYIDRMGREDPIIIDRRHRSMGGDYAAGELGQP